MWVERARGTFKYPPSFYLEIIYLEKPVSSAKVFRFRYGLFLSIKFYTPLVPSIAIVLGLGDCVATADGFHLALKVCITIQEY